MRKLDVFNHIYPRPYFDRMLAVAPRFKDIGKRMRGIPMLIDLDERFRVMDRFDDYQQILSIATPPIEVYSSGQDSVDLARLANDGMAELVAKHPDRFPGFVASLPLGDPDAAMREIERAVGELGARGIQLFSNINGKPLDTPEHLALFDRMAAFDLPVWLHPYRGADISDYASETKSKFEIWWTFGWPYETSVAMARLVFSGIFDRHPNLKIITHHLGAMAPYFEGRVGPGWDQLGTRTSDVDYTGVLEGLEEAADRLLPDVLRRHRGVRRLRCDGVRAEFLRRRSRAVRVRRAVRSGEGPDVHPRNDRDSRSAADRRRPIASRSTGATPWSC